MDSIEEVTRRLKRRLSATRSAQRKGDDWLRRLVTERPDADADEEYAAESNAGAGRSTPELH